MRRLVFTIVTVCFFETYQFSGFKPKESLCIVAGVIIRSLGDPLYYETNDNDEYEEIDENERLFRITWKINSMLKPTTTTTEAPPPNEWRLRGEYRIECVQETNIPPAKVINLMAGKIWKENNELLKKWVLCVLNKMNLMSRQGVFKLDVAMSKLHKNDRVKAAWLIDYCLPKEKLHPHEIAWRYVKCHTIVTPNTKNFTAISVF